MRRRSVRPGSTADAVYEGLASLAALLEYRSEASESGVTPPIELEQRLNGGRNPLIGRYYAELLTQDRLLPPDARILDLGCGYGRIALDLVSRLSDEQRYVGLDPNAEAVEWATANIAGAHPNFSFDRIDVVSGPYNPEGTVQGEHFRFPFDDDELDLVFMISVLTHVDLKTVEAYMREAARTLAPTGRLVATFFLLDDEVDALIDEGAAQFRMPWRVGESRVENPDEPELAIAHPRARVLEIAGDAGFDHVVVRDGNWSGRPGAREMDYQDLLIADVRTSSADSRVVPGEEDPELRDLAGRLASAGITADSLPRFLSWAASVSCNALWWESAGIPRVLDGLRLTVSRDLGMGRSAPDASASGAFVPVDDDVVLRAVVAAGARASRAVVVALIGEVVRNGLLVDRAFRSGTPPVQRLAGGAERVAPIPPPADRSRLRTALDRLLLRG